MTTTARNWRWLTVAVGFAAILSSAYAAWRCDWTMDEKVHLDWAHRFLTTSVSERLTQLRFDSKTPIVVPNAVAWKAAERLGEPSVRTLRFAARLPTCLWLLALLGAVFGLTRVLFGEPAAHLATLAAALDPNLIAHASLATSEIAFVLAVVLVLAACIAFARKPSASRAVLVGMALGLAFGTKINALLLVPTLLLLPLALERFPRWSWGGVARTAAQAAAMAAAVVLVISGIYFFRGLSEPFGSQHWRSAEMAWAARTFPNLALPLPTGFLTSLDFAFGLEHVAPGHRHVEWNVVLLGRRYPHGVWFYFAVLWLLKTPLLILAALGLGLFRAARSGLLLRQPAARFLAANLVLWLTYLSFFFRGQVGYRYALLCIPPACMLAAAGLVTLRWRAALPLGLVVVAASLLENALYAGNPLSFTNSLVWPKQNAFRLMSDSNIDWMQNHDKIEGWLAERGISKTSLNPPHIVPGDNVFSLNVVAGAYNFEQHRWLREHVDPKGHLGHTYVWFRIEQPVFEQFMTEARRLVPSPAAAPLCDDVGLSRFPAGSRRDVRLSDLAGEAWIVCVRAEREGTYFSLRGEAGDGRLSVDGAAGRRRWDIVEQGQSAWYLLDPGLHVFAVSHNPLHAPASFDGTYIVRGRAVTLGVRAGRVNADWSVTAAE